VFSCGSLTGLSSCLLNSQNPAQSDPSVSERRTRHSPGGPGLQSGLTMRCVDQTLAEVRTRVEQTRRNFYRLKLRGKEREIVEIGIRTVYRQGRRPMKVAVAQGRDNAFHRWRIRAKNLYYELQFLESVWPKRFHRMVSRLSRFQDRIGLDHDVSVLREWLKKAPEEFGGTETVQRVVTCLDSQTHKLRLAAVPLGRKIWREKPSRFAREVAQHWAKR
jgi:CHAD domain